MIFLYKPMVVFGFVLACSAALAARGAGHHVPGALPAPLTEADFSARPAVDADKIELGKNLFFDKILSGNRNIACATCHHALTATGDGLSLPVGEGGHGLGVTRDTGTGSAAIQNRVPRNAPSLFNLGAREFTVLFHDGRIMADPAQPSGFQSPAGADLPAGLQDALAVQAMFPVTSTTEMAGQAGENSVAVAAAAGNLAGPDGVWAQLAGRLQLVPEYVELFMAAYPDIRDAADITYVHAANAIAAFEASALRFDNSPFDRYLRGDAVAMSPAAMRGMRVFYGKGRCAGCHAGPLQTDHGFHAIAMPQIGPGKGDNLPGYSDGRDDLGRERVTADPRDRFRFRTPSLRNIALTAPYGHAGAYDSLVAVVRHHLDPVAALHRYDTGTAVLTSRDDLDSMDFIVMDDAFRRNAIAEANELAPAQLGKQEFSDLLDFLYALTDPAALDLRAAVPAGVPSGLPLAE
jgi:cytochrome c peroxidase